MSNNIDHIFYINLASRLDKRENIERELHNFGLIGERFDAIYHKEGSIGCANSHLEVLKLAKLRGYKNVLILEDDFMFLVSKEDFEKELITFFSSNLDFDVCFLSYNVIQYAEIANSNVNRAIDTQTASGYIVNAHYLDKLITLYQESNLLLENTLIHWLYANDISWKKYQPTDNWFYFKTRFGKQRPGISDNNGTYADYGV